MKPLFLFATHSTQIRRKEIQMSVQQMYFPWRNTWTPKHDFASLFNIFL